MSKLKTNFSEKTNDELVDLFNLQVGKTAWVSVKGNYLEKLRQELFKRTIDFNLVTNETGGFNLRQKVMLKNNKLIPY